MSFIEVTRPTPYIDPHTFQVVKPKNHIHFELRSSALDTILNKARQEYHSIICTQQKYLKIAMGMGVK